MSSSLLTALEQSNYTDRILILAAVFFFLLVCAYILKKRILDKAIYIIGGPGRAVGKIGGGKVAPTIGTILSGVTASLAPSALPPKPSPTALVVPPPDALGSVLPVSPDAKDPVPVAPPSLEKDELDPPPPYEERKVVDQKGFVRDEL